MLEVDAEKRRISLSIKQVKEATQTASTPVVPEAPRKPRKTGPLKGGLESGWFK